MENKNIKCSFCNRDKKEVSVMIAGITGHICNFCIEQAFQLVKTENDAYTGAKTKFNEIKLLKTMGMKKNID